MAITSKYLARQVESFEEMLKLEREATDPHLRRIATNVRRHVALEVGWERFAEALDPEWMVEDPHYRGIGSPAGGKTGFWDGMDAVNVFYDQFKGGALFTAVNREVYLAPNGIANIMDVGFYGPAEQLQVLLTPELLETYRDLLSDSEAQFHVSSYMVSFWPMDESARLKGEEFYHTGDVTVEKMAPEDVFTREELTEICRPYMDA